MPERPLFENIILFDEKIFCCDDTVIVEAYGREYLGRISSIDESGFVLDMSGKFKKCTVNIAYAHVDYMRNTDKGRPGIGLPGSSIQFCIRNCAVGDYRFA